MTPLRLASLGRKKHGKARNDASERRYLRAALIGVLLIVIAGYAAFVKQLPFSSSFVMRGVFASSNELQPGNPVRIAGLAIGQVASVTAAPGDHSLVTMNINEPGELHADASLAIEPRLLFEGNFYVSVNPGTPASPPMHSGAIVPMSHTSFPVQLDQVLDVLTQPTRASLKATTETLAAGLGPAPHIAGAQPGTGYAGLRDAIKQLNGTLPSLTAVATAAQGTRTGDLTAAIGSTRDVTAQLAVHPQSLADLVTSTDRVFAALSSNDHALADDVASLDRITQIAPPALSALNHALPTVTTFATALRPTLHVAPTALDDTNALLSQLQGLTAPGELPAMLPALSSVTNTLPTLERQLRQLFPELTALSTCTTHNLVPALNLVLQDGANSTGRPAWQDLMHMAAGLAGASEGFDGDGSAIRLGVAEGSEVLGEFVPSLGQIAGSFQGLGIRPTWLGSGVTPAFRPDQTCATQPLPQVNMAGNSASYPLQMIRSRATGGLASELSAALLATPSGRARALAALLGPTSPGTLHQPAGRANTSGSPTTPARPPSRAAGSPGSSAGTTATTSTTPAAAPSPLPALGSTLKSLIGGLLSHNSPSP